MADITGFRFEAVDPDVGSIEIKSPEEKNAIIAHVRCDDLGRPSRIVGIEMVEVDDDDVVSRNLFIGQSLNNLLSNEDFRNCLFSAIYDIIEGF